IWFDTVDQFAKDPRIGLDHPPNASCVIASWDKLQSESRLVRRQMHFKWRRFGRRIGNRYDDLTAQRRKCLNKILNGVHVMPIVTLLLDDHNAHFDRISP